jgi:hypothetical protein
MYSKTFEQIRYEKIDSNLNSYLELKKNVIVFRHLHHYHNYHRLNVRPAPSSRILKQFLSYSKFEGF